VEADQAVRPGFPEFSWSVFNVTSFCAQIGSSCQEICKLILELASLFMRRPVLFGGNHELPVSIAQHASIFDTWDMMATGRETNGNKFRR
jgi:hypothetical protein